MRPTLHAAISVALWLASGSGSAQARPDPSRIEHGLRAAVQIANGPDTTFDIRDRMRLYHVPGVSIAVIDNDRIVWAKGFGVKEFGKTEPVDTSTLFLAGSISKPVFATGALALVEQGKLSLDEDVNTKLRSWKVPESRFTSTEKVTLRRLLSHTAGLTVHGFPGYQSNAPLPTIPQVLDGASPANTPPVRNDTTPGARWNYSGGGLTVAQLLATDVTGEPLPALLQRLVLVPAHMTHSTYENPPPNEYARFAASGHERPDTPVPGRFHVYPEMAAAGFWTTASDLGRWAIALSRAYGGEKGGPLSPGMAKQMLTPQVTLTPPNAGAPPQYWGLGVGLAGAGDSLQFSHGGRDEGFVAELDMWPSSGRGLVILTNGVSGDLINEIQRAFDVEYRTHLTGPRVPKRTTALAADALDTYAGRYVLRTTPDTVFLDVRRDGKTLFARNTLTKLDRPLLPQAPDSFFDRETGTDWVFERDSTSHIVTALVRVVGAQRIRAAKR